MQNPSVGPGRPPFQGPGTPMRFNAPNYPVRATHHYASDIITDGHWIFIDLVMPDFSVRASIQTKLADREDLVVSLGVRP